MKHRKLPLLCCLILSALSLFNNRIWAQDTRARNDLFTALEGSCNNYMDVTANDSLNGQSALLFVLSQPANGSAMVSASYISYCATSGFTGSDSFSYQLTVAGNPTIARVYINVKPGNNYIFAGDADQNGRVEHFDVLALGLAYNLKGPARINEMSVNALSWQPSVYTNNDPGAADCNGDGIVNDNDLGIVDSIYHDSFPYPLQYVAVDTSPCRDGIPFYLESLNGDSVNDGNALDVAFKLGDGNNTREIYGVALTLEFDNSFIGGNQVSFATTSSWLLQNNPSLFFSRSFQTEGEIEIALTKTDHTGTSGNGELLRARLPIDDNIDGITTGPGWHPLNLKIKKARVINAYNVLQPVCVQQPALHVYKAATGLSDQKILTAITVYPNPANDKLTIEANNIQAIELTDITGRLLYNRQTSAINKAEIELTHLQLAAGSYLVKVQADGFIGTRKIIVQH